MRLGLEAASLLNMAALVLGIIAAVLIFAVLTGRTVPLVSGDRQAFFALAAIGFVMCTLTMSAIPLNPARGPIDWQNWSTIISSALGTMAILLVAVVLMGKTMPFISEDRAAFIAMAGIVASKFALSTLLSLI